MKLPMIFAIALAASAIPQTLMAQDADDAKQSVEVKSKSMIYDSEGKKIGRVYNIRENDDGSKTIQVIYQHKMLSIPESTLTADEKGFTTSSTRQELYSR